MEQHLVIGTVLSALGSPDEVMGIPSCHIGDLLLTHRAKSVLLFPEKEDFSSTYQGICHFHSETFLEVGLPLGIIGIGFCSDFRVSFDGHMCCAEEPALLDTSIWSKDFSCKHPISVFLPLEAFLPNPSFI